MDVNEKKSFTRQSFFFNVGSFESMPQSAQSGIPHRRSFYEVLFLEGGDGHHIIDFVPHEIAAPQR